jgi:hypothetical protein
MLTIRPTKSALGDARRWRTWSFSARELYPAPLHQSLRTAHGPSCCSSCGSVRGEISGAISGAPDVRTQAARQGPR